MNDTIWKSGTDYEVGYVSMDVKLRQLPYPYRAILTICSDLDETPDRHVYCEIMRFLNTIEKTSMGPGVGLEIGNSIYFDMPPDQFAYWNTDDAGRQIIRTLIKSGHIDCLHSYGDLATSRRHAARAIEELDRHGCKLEVWVDHGVAPTNFGSDIMRGHGDEFGHEAYHADLTTDFGIQYVWRGRVTSVVGQDIRSSLSGIFHLRHPVGSSQTLLKEFLKQKLAQSGNSKYAMHRSNEILGQVELRDKRLLYEFMRCNPHWGGVSSCDESRSIDDVLTDNFLNHLVEREGICILYTHLGKVENPSVPFDRKTVRAFERLAKEFSKGRILVTTTRRLLGYRHAVREISWTSTKNANNDSIVVTTQSDDKISRRLIDADLAGLTFYVSDPNITSIIVDGQAINHFEHNDPDHTGQRSVSLPWSMLEFPSI